MEEKEALSSLPLTPAIPVNDIATPSDQAFLQAAAIFQHVLAEKPIRHQYVHYEKKTDIASLPESGDKTTAQQALQLVFSTLKYQDLLEEMMMDSRFHTSQHIPSDLLPLAMVMLCNFRDRSFMPREGSTNGEEPQQEVRDLECRLRKCKTKLAASLARCRVKHGLRSASGFLPQPVRSKQQQARRIPCYAWVSTYKTSVEEVCEKLRLSGMSEVDHIEEVSESTFSRDPFCEDTLVLPQNLLTSLHLNHLIADHMLNVQDRSTCLAASALRPLLPDKADVLVAGSFSALTVAHVATMAVASSSNVLVCSADHTASQLNDLQELLKQMDVKNVRLLPDAFFSLNEWDFSIEHLKVIMVFPQCSLSALCDPVDTIFNEHGDWNLLQDLSRGSVSQSKIKKLTIQQAKLLAHALTFPQVQNILYCTRSVYSEENEKLVNSVLEKIRTPSKLLPFRVNEPIFPEDSQSGDMTSNKYFRLEPSPLTNGCFLACLCRQADPTKVETVQEVLARAAAKGLLDRLFPGQEKVKKKKSKTNPMGNLDQDEDKVEGQGKKEGTEGGRKKGLKKRLKRKIKPNHIKVVPKQYSAGHKKRKKKATKQTHRKRRIIKRKTRKFPRLTLALISSSKPYQHIFPAATKQESPTSSPKKDPNPARKMGQHTQAKKATKSLTGQAEGPVRSYMEEMANIRASTSQVLTSPLTYSILNSERKPEAVCLTAEAKMRMDAATRQ
ncbi:putative methyltransferase NSUN7 isoform X2 [Corythoichthys intestinalis]|uniref:putative methyltransferase NSUN7 isoform X2 n=1 Tax=Corythoichthys intestinalis TaxID=161448 RepID=UPI0025A5B157|nr:putative methyltransferase NSUN7 isoform X2 [Corythoichthys intestinalis]